MSCAIQFSLESHQLFCNNLRHRTDQRVPTRTACSDCRYPSVSGSGSGGGGTGYTGTGKESLGLGSAAGGVSVAPGGAHLRNHRPACPRRVAGDRRQRQVRQQSSCAAESSGAPEAASFSRPNNFAISSTRASTSPCEPVRTMIAAIMARHTRVHLQRHAHLSAKRTRVARAGAVRRAIPGRAVSASLRPDARC